MFFFPTKNTSKTKLNDSASHAAVACTYMHLWSQLLQTVGESCSIFITHYLPHYNLETPFYSPKIYFAKINSDLCDTESYSSLYHWPLSPWNPPLSWLWLHPLHSCHWPLLPDLNFFSYPFRVPSNLLFYTWFSLFQCFSTTNTIQISEFVTFIRFISDLSF